MSYDQHQQAAIDAYLQGKAHVAFGMLKTHKGMSVPDAKEFLESAVNNVQKGDGLSAQDEAALQEALGVVDTFDELTVLVLRSLRDNKQPISAPGHPAEAGEALQHCAAIYDAMKALIACDINPSRAMSAFVLKTNHVDRRSQDDEDDYFMMNKLLAEHKLRDDLLTLL